MKDRAVEARARELSRELGLEKLGRGVRLG